MDRPTRILADRDRLELFAGLGRSRPPICRWSHSRDRAGICWATTNVGTSTIGVTTFGPGIAFDPIGAANASDVERRLEAMWRVPLDDQSPELDERVGNTRFGPLAERLLWVIHEVILRTGRSNFVVADLELAAACWGAGLRPRHWRGTMIDILKSLTWLHVSQRTEAEPTFGSSTVLLTHCGDLRGEEAGNSADCPADCRCRGSRHHHLQIDVGPVFLGVLEELGESALDGSRIYGFPAGGCRLDRAGLRRIGKTGKLISVFLPAKLGTSETVSALTTSEHRLLQILVRETARAASKVREGSDGSLEIRDSIIVDFSGRRQTRCALLDASNVYVGFNGNGKRKDMGYRLDTPGGWLARAGYPVPVARYGVAEIGGFLDVLRGLAMRFGLTVIGVRKKGIDTLDKMIARSSSLAGTGYFRTVHLRVYTTSDYLTRWSSLFGWNDSTQDLQSDASPGPSVLDVAAELKRQGVSRRGLATGIGIDNSFLAKILNGMKPAPVGLLEKALSWLTSRSARISNIRLPPSTSGIRDWAKMYSSMGWCVLPQRSSRIDDQLLPSGTTCADNFPTPACA
jgi:hypothetical protein